MQYIVYSFIMTAMIYSQTCNQDNWQQYSPNLENCNLEGANIAWTDLTAFNLSGANLSNANLPGSNFSYANLSNANLSNADLTWTVLIGANLNNADLSESSLGAADFTGADLVGADLTGSTFFDTNFNDACIEGTIGFPSFGYIGVPVFEGCATPGTNTAPVALTATHTLDEDTSITFVLEAYDVDGDNLSYTLWDESAGPIIGNVSLSGNMATYVPDMNVSGGDSFLFIANDGQEDSQPAIVVLSINAVNDAPYLYPIEDDEIFLGETFTYNLTAFDADGDALIYTAAVSGGDATANIDGNILTIVPQESNTTLNVVVVVSDGNTTHSISFLLTVLSESTCLDNNSDGWCDQFPTITIIDGNATILMQGSSDQYVDSGASCQDQEDGDISHQVEVSGDIVNINLPGTYAVSYNCSDSNGNVAQTKQRMVFVIPPLIADLNEDGFDDDAFIAGTQSGDINGDGVLNIIDIIQYVSIITIGN